MSERPLFVGIDLGTTNSAIAVFDGQTTQLVRNAQGGNLTPSVVRMDAKGGVSVGAKARRMLEADPKNTRAEFKRLMGTETSLEFVAAKTAKKPEELAAEVLKSLLTDVREQLGITPRRAVISVPALFEIPQSAATSEAARIAGLEQIELIQEPIASAIAAGWRADEGDGNWLVYDLGGGTFDVSLLETNEGFLRIVGHEGDNFLGGRDIDWAIVDWALTQINKEGGNLSRSNPSQANAIHKLKFAAEEAKIELGREQQTNLFLPALLENLDVDLTLNRATLEALAAPIIERTLVVCHRLLDRYHIQHKDLKKIVLVGGPTAMQNLRQKVASELGAPVTEGLDPMTLVAQGAALFAASVGLNGAPTTKQEVISAHKLQLHYPPISSDLCPHIVGRLLGEISTRSPAKIRLVREDGWSSEEIEINPEDQTFVISVDLKPREVSSFSIQGIDKNGSTVVLNPDRVTIVQGLTITDPPLSRSIGIALADGNVRTYFERGTPLPARRTFQHKTVEGIACRIDNYAIKIPIVQGELPFAHLCRLVGMLEIRGSELQASLPIGTTIEVSLDVDRGGKLSARAMIPSTQQLFEQVAHLMVPEASPETLMASHQSCSDRLSIFRQDAFRQGDAGLLKKLHPTNEELENAQHDIQAALGGDADAAQKARRTLLELESFLDHLEFVRGWPEMEDQARSAISSASFWVSVYGTDIEKQYLKEAIEHVEEARKQQNTAELMRQLKVVYNLQNTAYYRDPEAWANEFSFLCSQIDNTTDLPKARSLMTDGQRAIKEKNNTMLRTIVENLWKLLPVDLQTRSKGHQSGVM